MSEIVGRTVSVRRNPHHHANMRRVETGAPSGAPSFEYVPREDLVMDLGRQRIVDTKLKLDGSKLARDGSLMHRRVRLVRLENGVWYDLATGLQDRNEMTLIILDAELAARVATGELT